MFSQRNMLTWTILYTMRASTRDVRFLVSSCWDYLGYWYSSVLHQPTKGADGQERV